MTNQMLTTFVDKLRLTIQIFTQVAQVLSMTLIMNIVAHTICVS